MENSGAFILGRNMFGTVGLPTKSISPDDAAGHFGPRAMFVGGNGPASSTQTKQRLRWEPRELNLIADIEQNYFA